MATRGKKIVELARKQAKNDDIYDFKSEYETYHEKYQKSDYMVNPELGSDTNWASRRPMDVSESIKKTSEWINQNRFKEMPVAYISNANNFETRVKEKIQKDCELHEHRSCEEGGCNCSHVSPSEVDDSVRDIDYIPDSDNATTNQDSFAHESLSPSSNESVLLVNKQLILPIENVSSQRKQIYSNEVKTRKRALETNKKSEEKLQKKTNKDCFVRNTPNDQNELFPIDSSVPITGSFSNNLKEKKQDKFCNDDIANKNFMRHLKRRHNDETEVIQIFNLPQGSKERRHAFTVLRNNTNFDLFITGVIRPSRQCEKAVEQSPTYYPCAYCKGIFTKQYLKRHAKSCFLKNADENRSKVNNVTLSQTMVACAIDPTKVIAKLNVKEQVFNLMKGDDIAFQAKKDLLIANFGESFMKKHKRERMAYACSNRMRELSRLLISFRKITNNEKMTFTDILHPKHFDNVLYAVRKIVGWDHEKKTFRAPSLAMHLGTSLKMACDELTHLILKQNKGFRCRSVDDAKTWLTNIKYFKKLIESRWNIEMASLANKELQEKRWNRPLLLPLVGDIKKFRDEVTRMAEEAMTKLSSKDIDKKAFKLLNQCALSLLILFNRRRIGDVQYLKIENYKTGKKSNYKDFENALTETEKALTKRYRRVLNSGKGCRAVVILIPEELEKMIQVLLKHRDNYILDQENEYVFAMPDSTIKWGKGDVAIRALCKKVQLENPEAISSNKLRKQIATVLQILNLTPDEAKQFSNFMGHTQKTHDEFYELPVDIYQTAKVSKLLLMMEKGTIPVEFKGKSLEEINFDPTLEFPEEDENGKDAGVENEAEAPGFYAQQTPIITDVDAEENDLHIAEDSSARQNLHFNETSDENMPTISTNQIINTKDDSMKIRKKSLIIKREQRLHWSNKELHLVKKEFSSYINKGCYPSGEVIKLFLAKTGIDRTVMTVKSKIQHLIKTKTQK